MSLWRLVPGSGAAPPLSLRERILALRADQSQALVFARNYWVRRRPNRDAVWFFEAELPFGRGISNRRIEARHWSNRYFAARLETH